MRHLIRFFGKLIGIHFAPDNHVVPVLRLERYHRVKGPGIFWIVPLLEMTLPSVKTSLHIGEFYFEEVMSKDNIPFKVKVTVLFTFNPDVVHKSTAALLVRGGNDLFKKIVKDYTDQAIRRLASRFDAEELCGESAILTIERDLTYFLRGQMHMLGLAPLRTGGVLIKETIAADEFKRAMLDARRDAIRTRRLEAILEVLAGYPLEHLIRQAIQAGFVTGLEDLEGSKLTLLSTLSPLEEMRPGSMLDAYKVLAQDGQNGQGRY